MILKIERYSENQQYWMLDNIRKYSVSRLIPRSGNLNEDSPTPYDIQIFDTESKCTCRHNGKTPENSCSDCIYFYLLICRMDDGSEMTIAFDTSAYVMNDEGKTIDKIVANYQVFDSKE